MSSSTRPRIAVSSSCRRSESAAGTPGGESPAYVFSDDFPGPPGIPAPALVEQLLDLVDRYIVRPADPRWPARWARMYDRSGFPRYAVNILHVASRHVDGADDAAFAAGFDLVANRVLQFTGVAIGFTLDLLPSRHSYKIGDDQGWVPWFELPDNIRIPPGSQISQTWANRNHLDLFATDVFGNVHSTWWDDAEPNGYRPGGWFPLQLDRMFPPGASVTAIRRTEGHLDLFATDKNGVVRTIWWDEDVGGYSPDGWLPIHPEVQCPPGAPVAASWGNEDHLDIFVIERHGTVMSIYWDANVDGGYRPEGWFPIGPSTVFHPGGHVSAEHRDEDHLDLWAADQDGVVRSIWWNSDEGFRADGWFAIDPQTRTVAGARISAVWADDKHLDLFMTDRDGVVRSTFWDAREPGGYRPQGWFKIGPGLRSVGGAPVETLWSHDSTVLHLFVVDLEGHIAEAFWKNDDDPLKAWRAWMALWPKRLHTLKGGTVTASHPRGVHLDAIVVDDTGRPFTSWQDEFRDTYIGVPERLGPLLLDVDSVLAVQAFIPEIWMGGSDDDERLQNKGAYCFRWALQGVPVIMDADPGYDGHLVFSDSAFYGFTPGWRDGVASHWQSMFTGIVYNAWNGYTEGLTAMRSVEHTTDDFEWLQRMFRIF